VILARVPGAVAREENSVVTVGTFDGVHIAHRAIIGEVVARARAKGGRSVVLTFDPHPKQVVAPAAAKVELLTTVEERIEQFRSLGVDLAVVVTFTREFSQLTPREFYEERIVRPIGCSEVIVGYDHMFGRNREAGIEELKTMGAGLGFTVRTVEPFLYDGAPVSSTRIRTALDAGSVSTARALLGRPYELTGKVVRGDGRGRQLGFPTANLDPGQASKVIPSRGVYVVGVSIGGVDGFGIMNIGIRPTVDAGLRETREVHILDFDRECYDEELTVRFLERLREERKFASLQDLTAQIQRDRDAARMYLAQRNH
jgi:riboflavin kinase / FMN adenylyltransferase